MGLTFFKLYSIGVAISLFAAVLVFIGQFNAPTSTSNAAQATQASDAMRDAPQSVAQPMMVSDNTKQARH